MWRRIVGPQLGTFGKVANHFSALDQAVSALDQAGGDPTLAWLSLLCPK